jgi:hypothetical protein
LIRVEDLIARKKERIELFLRRTQIECDFTTEVFLELAIPVEANKGFLDTAVTLERFLNVNVVESFNITLLGVSRSHWLRQFEYLDEGGQPLLPIENEALDIAIRGMRVDPFDRSDLESGCTAGFKQHNAADWKCSRDADKQRLDVLVVPYPPTLEIGQLDFSLNDLL